MTIQAILNYKKPEYPTVEEFTNSPNELILQAPAWWKGNKLIWTALLALTCSYCNSDINLEKHFSKDYHVTQGLVGIVPPITEQSAKSVIYQEFANRGVYLNTSSSLNQKLFIKVQRLNYGDYNEKRITNFYYSDEKVPIYGYNEELRLAVVYLDDWVFDNLKDYNDYQIDDFHKTLKRIIKTIKAKSQKIGNQETAIFYDPTIEPDFFENQPADKYTATNKLIEQINKFFIKFKSRQKRGIDK